MTFESSSPAAPGAPLSFMSLAMVEPAFRLSLLGSIMMRLSSSAGDEGVEHSIDFFNNFDTDP